MIKRIEQYKVFIILFSLLLLTTIISTNNPFKTNLLAADEAIACYNACLVDLGETETYNCEYFCNPASHGYNDAGGCTEISERWGKTYVDNWCQYIETNKEMCAGGCRAENSSYDNYAPICDSMCQTYTTASECSANIADIGEWANSDFCHYLDGIYLPDYPGNVMTTNTEGINIITGSIVAPSIPTSSSVYDDDVYNESCIFVESSTNTWTFSCSTDSLSFGQSYNYYLDFQGDDGNGGEYYYYKDIVINVIGGPGGETYLWDFEANYDWADEVKTHIPGIINGENVMHSTDPQGKTSLDTTLGGYINYVDTTGKFSFSGPSAHFKVEAEVKKEVFGGGSNRLIGKYNDGDSENTWLLGTDNGGGVYCAIWIGEDQEAIQTGNDIENPQTLTNNSWNTIGCEWNATTRELKAYLNGTNIATNEIPGVGYIADSANLLTINGRADGADGVNAYIDNIKIFDYSLQDPEPEGADTIEPILVVQDEFTIKNDLLTTEITGTVMDNSEIKSVQIKRADGEIWNSCNVTPSVVTGSIPAPVGLWKLDETTGSLLDTSGNNNNATSFGDSTSVEGILGNAMHFDGNGDYLEMSGSTGFPSGSSARTVSAWVKVGALNGFIHNIFHYGNTMSNEAWGLAVFDDNRFGLDQWGYQPREGSISTGQWMHLAITLDDTGYMTYYKNGEEVASNSEISLNTVLDRTPKIGTHVGGNGDYFEGAVDEVYLFDSELTQEQITKLYSTGFNTYDFSCWTGPLADLSTNEYEIRATDASDNITSSYSAYVEADDFGGLDLQSLWRLEDRDYILDEIGIANEGYYSYSDNERPLVQGRYGNAFDLNWDRRVFIDDFDQDYSFQQDGSLPHIRVEGTIQRDGFNEGEQRVVISKETIGNRDVSWKLGVANGLVECVLNLQGGEVKVTGDDLLASNQWYTVACDWNAQTGELKVYLDGNQTGTTTTTDINISQREFPYSTGRLILGGMGQDSYFDPLSGYLDNVKVYYEALDSEEQTSPELTINSSDKFKILNTGDLEISGSVYDESWIQSVEVKRSDESIWESCTIDDNPTPATPPTPLAHWSFEEGSGVGAYILDSGTGHYNATPNTQDGNELATFTYAGFNGNARQFVSDGAYIEIDSSINSVLPSGAEPRAVSAWIKLESKWCPFGLNPIFSYGGEGEGGAWTLAVNCDRRIGIHEGTHDDFIDVELTPWQWSLLTVSMDGLGNKTYYLNGENVGVTNYTPDTNTIDNNPPKIGSFWNGNHYFFGEIDEVSIFDKALTDDEVTQIYTQTRDNYGFSCLIDSAQDLQTNLYQIRATDDLGNETPEQDYATALAEVDRVGGLELMSLWRFEERDNIEDTMKVERKGTYSYDPERQLVTGVYDNAVDLNGDRRIFIDDTDGDFSFIAGNNLLAHAKFEAYIKEGEYVNYRTVMSKETSDHENVLWRMLTTEFGKLQCIVNLVGETVTATGVDTLTNDQWYKVGCDWNAQTGELKAYLNGEVTGIATTDIDISQRVFPTSTGRLVLGGMGQDSYFDPFSGYLDNVKVYYESLPIPTAPIILENSSALITTNSYTLNGIANSNSSDNIVQVQYRKYLGGQAESEGWNNCTCENDSCENPTENFSCSIINIPESTTTYEIRYGYGDPLSYLSQASYAKLDITRDTTDTLLSWWSFDKATAITDYSGNELNGSLIGNSPLSSHIGSLTNTFDGDTYFEIPDGDRKLNLNGSYDEFTVDMMIKPDEGLNTNEDYHLLYKGDLLWAVKIYVTNEGNYSAVARINSNEYYYEVGYNNSNTYLTPGQWNHVVFSYSNQDATITMRVNDNAPAIYGNSIRFLMQDSTAPFTIGARTSGGNKFKGEIDDIKIYNSADTKSPNVAFKPLDDSQKVTTNPNQEFEMTITDETGVESFDYLFFDDAHSENEIEEDVPITTRDWVSVLNPTEGNWGDKEIVIKINAPNLADGVWYLYTRATDSNDFATIMPYGYWYITSGYSTPSSIPYYQFYVEARDTTPPQIFAHSIIPNQTVDTNPGVRGYVKDDPSDTISAIASLEYNLEIGTLEGEIWTPGEIGSWESITPLGIENVFDQPTEEFYLKLENLVPGDYKLEIRAEDASGNSTEDNDTNHLEYFTIYEINPKPDTTVLIKEEDFSSHAYHDLLFSDGVWGNGILRLRQAVEFQQEQVLFTDNNDFGYQYGEYHGKMSDSIDGNLWIVNNDSSFMYYNITTEAYTRYPIIIRNQGLDKIYEFEFEGDRYLILEFQHSTLIYDINNTPENSNDDSHVDYSDKAGFADNKAFKFVDFDTRNNKFALFAMANPAEENFIIWLDTKKTIMNLDDDTYVTWGPSDNLFYNSRLAKYHTDHDIVTAYFDQELDTFLMGAYYDGALWVCNDGGDPENKANDVCKDHPTWAKFSILKDTHGYYWVGGNSGLRRIDTKNTPNVMDDTFEILLYGDEWNQDTISDMVFIPGNYPVGDELWFITSSGFIKGIEYNFTYDDKLDDTYYSYQIATQSHRAGVGGFFSLRGDDTFYIISQSDGLQKITLTRSFESLNTIEMLPIPPDGILAINYIDLEDVLGSVTNGSQYTLNDLVTYEVSNDSGVTWYPITQGQRVNFPTPDYKLKLRITLRSGSSPIIDALTLSYVTYPQKEGNLCDIKIQSEAPQITTIQPNTNNTFTVNFAPLSSQTVQTYKLEYGPSNSDFTTGTLTVPKGTNIFTVTGIEKDKEYFFRVKAVSDCTSSLWSNVVSSTNTDKPDQPIVVAPPKVKPVKPNEPITEESLCGNGVLDEGEQCDYANTQTYMCEDGSTAVCTVECTLDTGSCKEDDSKIPIIDKIKENIKDVEKDRDGEAISAAQVANWAVKLISLSLLTLSVPLIPYYFMRILLGIPYIIGMRRRDKEYGYVYDSITKEPIKQAIVRIYSGDKLVHTDVTGTYGEFGGNIKAGVYTLSVQKPQYTFPSSMVVGSTDMHISNVYNGKLEVQENAEIITAVPIDSNKAKVFDIFKTIVINRTAILLQFIKLLLFVGLLAYSIYAYKTNSNTLNLIVLIEYAIVLAVLLLSSLSRDIKYGKITNAYDEPVAGVNVGLFEREFNKLQTERITNEKGQYRFIIKPGTYEIRSLTPGYTLQNNNVITVNDEPSVINKDLKITNGG